MQTNIVTYKQNVLKTYFHTRKKKNSLNFKLIKIIKSKESYMSRIDWPKLSNSLNTKTNKNKNSKH